MPPPHEQSTSAASHLRRLDPQREAPTDHRQGVDRTRNKWRVMLESTRNFKRGDTIDARLQYALQAPNGRRIPIAGDELADWLDDCYRPGRNKRHEPVALARFKQETGMWPGTVIGTTRLQRGDWKVLRSDESVLGITQMHTGPMSKLSFGITRGGLVSASYPPFSTKRPLPNENKNAPDADSNANPNRTGAHTNTTI